MAKPDIAAEIRAFNSPQALVMHYEGSTRKAAEHLGVTQRTIQRYLKGTRKPAPAIQKKLAMVNRNVGMTLNGTIAVNGRGANYERDRTIDRVFSPDEWAELSEMAAQGDAAGIYDFIANDYGVDFIEVMDGEIDIGED